MSRERGPLRHHLHGLHGHFMLDPERDQARRVDTRGPDRVEGDITITRLNENLASYERLLANGSNEEGK